jgi:hypothetical protein
MKENKVVTLLNKNNISVTATEYTVLDFSNQTKKSFVDLVKESYGTVFKLEKIITNEKIYYIFISNDIRDYRVFSEDR